MAETTQPSVVLTQSNPFFERWDTPFGVPPFERMKPEHFMPAFERAFAEHEGEVAAIAADKAAPTFDNTILALEKSGRALQRVDDVFGQLSGTMSNDAFLEIERQVSPLVAAHWNRVRMNEGLFARIDALHRDRARLGLTPEQARVLERYHTVYRRNGAALDAEQKKSLAAITERLAALGTAFSQNVLADEQSYTLALDGEAELAGLPDFVREAARNAAEERGLKGHVVTLQRSSVEPFLQFSSRRDLREKAWRAWQARGDNNDKSDNKAIIAETLKLRAERARLLGYPTYAHYRLDDAMAKTPANVRGLLEKVWAPARVSALKDRDDMQEIIREEGGNFALAPWDWRYYAEKLRQRRCDIEEAAVKPYMQLDNVIEAAFYTANKLFGLSFAPIDVPVWHPDVRAWEVKDSGGQQVGIFYGDYYARPSKHSGAWMGSMRDQEKLSGRDVRPVVHNVMNFNKGDPTLLSFDDARTLFHEFGHALHGLLSNVTYPQVSGTSVLTDWVELPSQLYEHWFEQPEVLSRFARHFKTGEPMPDALLKRLLAARNFDKGRETVEYIASAMIDLDLHSQDFGGDLDINAFERKTLAEIGMPAEIVMRHRPPHFGHVFSGGYYASAYYSYMWSETLDADAFAAFEEAGDIFDATVAKKLATHVLSSGGSRDPAELYVAFRGRLPTADALLKKRGFADKAA